MPTSYTQKIADGISFKQYAMLCARAMGACVTMRDDDLDKDIPEAFAPSGYYKEQLDEANNNLVYLYNMDEQGKEQAAETEYQQALDNYNKRVKESKALEVLYTNMLQKVAAYIYPTEDHKGLKDFMIDQIEISMSDCDTRYMSLPCKLTSKEWFDSQLINANRDVIYYTKQHNEEIQRVTSRNNWLKALRYSLKDYT